MVSENSPTPRGAKVEIGAWSGKGEFLGKPARFGETYREESREGEHLYVGRGDEDHEITVTLHSFDGGYRVLVEQWDQEERRIWLAPVEEEEESYIGLFSEEEAREAFPYLFAVLEVPASIEKLGLRSGGPADG